MVYTYVKGGTGEYAVANKVVVYAYNMWYPCTVYVHVYTLYVHTCTIMCMVLSVVLTAILRGYIGGISLHVLNTGQQLLCCADTQVTQLCSKADLMGNEVWL